MEVAPHLQKFIYTNMKRFTSKEFIIDTMTMTTDRPQFVVYDDEMPTPDKLTVTICYHNTTTAKYVTPTKLDELSDIDKTNPTLAWRAETGIELLYATDDIYAMIMMYRNWHRMTQEQKDKSDAQQHEISGGTNAQLFDATIRQLSTYPTIVTLVTASGRTVVVNIDELTENKITYTYLGNGDTRLLGETDELTLPPGILQCHKGSPIKTTIGKFLLNVLLIELPFGDKISYRNDKGFGLKDLEKAVAKYLMAGTITVEAYKQYLNNLYFIGHFTELCVPSYSRASLTTHPDMQKVKTELLAKYADRLTEPAVINEIENTLIKLDKEHLASDNSMRFYGALGGKAFNVARKKLYLTVGGIESFSKDSGKYTFIQNSLQEGWTVSAIPAISNEIRKGSYNRGHETQLGGAQSNYIMKVFQDLVLSIDDCGAVRGISIDFSKQNINEFLGRYINVAGKWVAITEDTINKYNGNKYTMRTPMYCKSKHGMCKKCAGDVFTKLSVGHLTMMINDISATFTSMSLAAMHGSKLELVDLGDLDQYIV